MSTLVEYLEKEGYSLKPSGVNFRMTCPFHEDKDPSFRLYTDTDSFYCFSCKRGGGLVSFLMYRDGISYDEALKLSGQSRDLESSSEKVFEIIKLRRKPVNSQVPLLRSCGLKIRELMIGGEMEQARGIYDSIIKGNSIKFNSSPSYIIVRRR